KKKKKTTMKQNIILTMLLLLLLHVSEAQTKDYKVVFDLTSKDTSDHKSVLRWLNGISQSNADARLEVVFYGQSLGMVTKDKSTVAEDIKKLIANKNISFKVCEAAMKRHNIDKSQLLPGIETVPDGIYEIILKQGEGWGYIKVAR
ncbi:MAG: DsrE family protein, partial [Chitinophagaceae bacterium]